MDNKLKVASERERGKGMHFNRIRRITGYITPNLSTWNDAKRSEVRDRVTHA